MSFRPISIKKYIEIHLKNNPSQDESMVRESLASALDCFLKGVKCNCGNDIWVIGSAFVGNSCFTCITGESYPSDDYEIKEALPKSMGLKKPLFSEASQSGYFDDDGSELNPNLIPKPNLCLSCINNNNPKEEIMCNLTRLDQSGENDFCCFAYKKDE